MPSRTPPGGGVSATDDAWEVFLVIAAVVIVLAFCALAAMAATSPQSLRGQSSNTDSQPQIGECRP